jgi:hypothetical protein
MWHRKNTEVNIFENGFLKSSKRAEESCDKRRSGVKFRQSKSADNLLPIFRLLSGRSEVSQHFHGQGFGNAAFILNLSQGVAGTGRAMPPARQFLPSRWNSSLRHRRIQRNRQVSSTSSRPIRT